MKKQDRCVSTRQKRARGCGANHTKEVWHLRPERHDVLDPRWTHSVLTAKAVWDLRPHSGVAPAAQEFHRTTPRPAAGRIKGLSQVFCAIGRLQPDSAAMEPAARLGMKRTVVGMRCPFSPEEYDGETQVSICGVRTKRLYNPKGDRD